VLTKSAPSSSCLNSQTIAWVPSSMNTCRSDCGELSRRLRRRPSCFWKTSKASLCSSSSSSDCVTSSALFAWRSRWRSLGSAPAETRAGVAGAAISVLMDDLRIAVGGDPSHLGLQLGRDLHLGEHTRNEVRDFLGDAVDHDLGLLEQFA